MLEIYYVPESQMKDWQEICQAFADKFGYTLLFVNSTSCGVELKDGSFRHIYVSDMKEIFEDADNVKEL